MRVLGIDYGRKRVGLALSDATGLLARPWKTLDVGGNPGAAARDIVREIESLRNDADGLAAVVIGFPRRLSGEPNAQTTHVEALAARLRELGVPIVLQDERLSSREAESLLARREKSWRRRKPLLDSTAAAVILQDYLDSRSRPSVTDPELRTDPSDA